jgi:flagellin
MISIVTNTPSLEGQRNLSNSNQMLNQSLQRLSTGYRINSAMDDAAGLSVSENMRSQVRGLAQASRNALDGLSVVQTAEGAMGEISSALIRMRELSVQSATDTISDVQRSYINTEFNDLVDEINRTASTTTFNGINLLDGSTALNGLDFQVGFDSGANFRINVKIDDVSTSGLGFLGTEGLDTKTNAQAAMDVLDNALSLLSTARAGLGAKGNRLMMAGQTADQIRGNLSAANSRIRDTDMAAETANLSKAQVLMQAGTAMLAQANSSPQQLLRLVQ